ncbi:uncharacterized protein TM35_000092070 [Trypanosoma theileri]|uniref:Uncharacterized protein n=1 Tax=Trypanosoma theileri TaxID=67003 RepID=A0A1X0NZP0_9TRYP|nr:uncharacterized protein TM35_000092070 [Trypanosoma theileri]ORC90157.1 hypothetical protein TM35_000092070 [Trypanosoma theileri]
MGNERCFFCKKKVSKKQSLCRTKGANYLNPGIVYCHWRSFYREVGPCINAAGVLQRPFLGLHYFETAMCNAKKEKEFPDANAHEYSVRSSTILRATTKAGKMTPRLTKKKSSLSRSFPRRAGV